MNEQEMRSIYAHKDLMASLDELLTMPPEWVDEATIMAAQDKLALVIQRKRKAA